MRRWRVLSGLHRCEVLHPVGWIRRLRRIPTDAMGCQKDIAEKIQKQGGDYLFAVKGNQGRLNKAFEEKFPLKELNNPEHDSYAISEKSHGREEIRLHIVCDVPDELIDFTFEWKGLKKLCVAVSFRSIIAEQKKEPEMTVRYYISSADLTAEIISYFREAVDK